MRPVNYYTRQGHKRALVYLKSGIYCDRREKQLEYVVVLLSVALCLCGILFSILPQMFLTENAKFANLCEQTVTYLGVASGVFLVIQLIIKSVTTRLHSEAVSSIERFDNYVYDLPPNRMILRPMPEAQLESHAAKIRCEDAEYINPYFLHEVPADPLVIYQNQREIFVNEYHLMLYVRMFINVMCGLLAVFIFTFALAADAEFLVTLQKIFFPSISIISILVTSCIGLNKTLRFLQNVLTQYESNEKNPDFDKRCELALRQNQDAIFQYRMICSTVPLFLIRRYEKSAFKRQRSALADDDTTLPKTSLFITATQERKMTTQRTQATKRPRAKKAKAETAVQPEPMVEELPEPKKKTAKAATSKKKASGGTSAAPKGTTKK